MPSGDFIPAQLNDLPLDVALSVPPLRGSLLFRGASKWNDLAPTSAGQILGLADQGGGVLEPRWGSLAPYPQPGLATGTVGLTAVNGIASTFLRSDAAPALSQAITPTWTGLHTFQAQTSAKAAVFKAAATTPDNITEWQDGNGVLMTSVGAAGQILAPSNSARYNYSFTGQSGTGLYYFGPGIVFGVGNADKMQLTGSLLTVATNIILGWGVPTSTQDTGLARNAAGILEVNNGTAGTFAALRVGSPTAGTIAQVIRGTTSQTGVLLQLQGQSSTTAGRPQDDIDTAWNVSTDASRSADLILRAWYVTTAREGLRIRGGSSDVQIGLFGVTPVSRPGSYTPTNVTTDRSFNADSTTLDEIADVLGTLIADLQSLGAIS